MTGNFSYDLSLVLTALVASLLSLIIFDILIRNKSAKRNHLNLPPGSYGWPVLGESLEFLGGSRSGTPGKFVEERKEKYKSEVFKTSLMGESVAVICDGPNGYKFLFSNENKLVRIWWPASVRRLLGRCLSTTSGVEGMQMRKMVSQFFSPHAFTKLYIRTMDLVAQQHINTHWQGKEVVKVFPAIRSYTFEVACRLFMSIEEPEQIAKLASLFNVFIKGVISIPLNFPGTRFFKANRATDAIRRELQMIVRRRRVELEQNTVLPSQDLLSHLLASADENGDFMPESVIINNTLLLLFAGHDTSSSAIMMLIKYLAEIPEIHEQVLQEQKEISASKEGEFLQWEDIQKMKYSWNVASEVLRFSSPVVGAFREVVEDLKYGGYDIPKGWKFYWNAPTAHMDPSLFPECEIFNPSRYDGGGPIPYSYVPFGGGPRMCLGKEFARLEILIFLHNLIKIYRWDLVSPGEKIIYDPIPTPVNGLPISLHPRNI